MAGSRIAKTDDVLIMRCAWCRCYEVGDKWLGEEIVQAFLRRSPSQRVTHGICPDCNVDLRRRGLSTSG